MAGKRKIRLWFGVGLGIERKMNRYGRRELYLVLPLTKIKISENKRFY